MRISVFIGDIADARAEAVCTSTNPRLSLMMGTGGSIRSRGGFAVLRECEEIVETHVHRTGRHDLPVASAWVTSAGTLPFRAVIHCVACDRTHLSSTDVVKACVRNALARADELGCASVAMPVFGTGHARLKFERALPAMAEVLRAAKTNVQEVVVVLIDPSHASEATEAFAGIV